MGLLERIRKQHAIYWPQGPKDATGAPTFGAAQSVKVRWEDIHEEFVLADGTKAVSSSMVYVGQDMPNGWLFLTALLPGATALEIAAALAAAPADPRKNKQCWPIKRFEKIPKRRPNSASKFLRIAIL